ncbi:hypothetical protein C8Q80DRAFT_544234 [Daedaleopsis nitida]|nr:hypothetical protein C8Q80DRAFT_544234 [Daedaleopsis nitida]
MMSHFIIDRAAIHRAGLFSFSTRAAVRALALLVLTRRLSFLFPTMSPSPSPSPSPRVLSTYSEHPSAAEHGSVKSSESSQYFPSYSPSARLLQSHSFPPISYRFAATLSSPSLSAASDSPYLGPSRPLSLGDSYTLSPDPQKWGTNITPEYKEEDDDLHKPDTDHQTSATRAARGPFELSWRGVSNLGTLVLLLAAILTLL